MSGTIGRPVDTTTWTTEPRSSLVPGAGSGLGHRAGHHPVVAGLRHLRHQTGGPDLGLGRRPGSSRRTGRRVGEPPAAQPPAADRRRGGQQQQHQDDHHPADPAALPAPFGRGQLRGAGPAGTAGAARGRRRCSAVTARMVGTARVPAGPATGPAVDRAADRRVRPWQNRRRPAGRRCWLVRLPVRHRHRDPAQPEPGPDADRGGQEGGRVPRPIGRFAAGGGEDQVLERLGHPGCADRDRRDVVSGRADRPPTWRCRR